MIKGHVIRLEPNNKQATYFAKACGVARFAYNWALNEWQHQYQADKTYRDHCTANNLPIDDSQLNKPSQGKLRKQLNAIKREQYPFMLEVTKCSPQMAIIQLGDAFNRFFKGQAKYPRPRKKGRDDRFTLTNDQFRIDGKRIKIPNLGWVKTSEKLRFNGKALSAKVFKKGGQWFVSVAVELAQVIQPKPKTGKAVGIDLGIKDLLVLSNGMKIQAPKPLKTQLAKLRRLNKSLSRKQKGSNNREKAKTKLSRLHAKIGNIRSNSLHQITTYLVSEYDVLAIEDLNVSGMVQNRKLSRAISDLGFYEFKRQLIYKAVQWGKVVKSVDRFYPSSKTCSNCGHKVDELPLSVRMWQCPNCHIQHDRDINASMNILANANNLLTA